MKTVVHTQVYHLPFVRSRGHKDTRTQTNGSAKLKLKSGFFVYLRIVHYCLIIIYLIKETLKTLNSKKKS